MEDGRRVLRTSLIERLTAMREVPEDRLPGELPDVIVRRVELPGPDGDVLLPRPADWEALRHAEAAAGRPIPYWARLWPAGLSLASALAAAPPPHPGLQVLELGCGLALPSIVAARSGARVLATDSSPDAVAYAAHGLALNGVEASVAQADWDDQGEALAAEGPWDLAREFLAAARASFHVWTERDGPVALHTLRHRTARRRTAT